MGLLLLLAPALGAGPQWHRTHRAGNTASCSSPVPALYGPCVPVYPPGPPPPRSVCHRRQLRLLGFSALHAPSLWFLSYPKPSCTAPERHPILQNLSRERRKQACAAASSLHQPFGPPHYYQPTLAYLHSTTVACHSLALFPPFASSFFFFQKPPLPITIQWTGWRRDRPHSPNTACLARTTPATTTLLYANPGLRAEVYRPITTAVPTEAAGHWAGAATKERWKGTTEARVAEAWCPASCCW